MLDNISKYKKIRQSFLSGRIDITGNIFGTRAQKLPKLNEDVVFLTEAAALTANLPDNSIMPDYPFSNPSLPEPDLNWFVDGTKLGNLDIDGEDLFKKNGGEDPDWERLEAEEDRLNEQRYTKRETARDRLQQDISALNLSIDNIVSGYTAELSSLGQQLLSARGKYAADISAAELVRDEEISSLAEEEQRYRDEYQEKTIDLSTLNRLLVQIDDNRHDVYLNFFKEKEAAMLVLENDLWRLNVMSDDAKHGISSVVLSGVAAARTISSVYDQTISAVEDEYFSGMNQIWQDSNFEMGQPYFKYSDEVNRRINDLSIYRATSGLSRAMPRAGGKDNIYYLERLFADWEKLEWKLAAPTVKCVNGNIVEHYSAEYEGGLHTSFDRFIPGDYIYYDYEYSGDSETATFNVQNTLYDIRIGGRYDVGKILALKLIFAVTAGGVDGDMWKYAVIDANKVGAVYPNFLEQLDTEEDRHQTAMNKLDDDYDAVMLSTDNEDKFQRAIMLAEHNTRNLEIDNEYKDKEKDARRKMVSGSEQYIKLYNDLVNAGQSTSYPEQQLKQLLDEYDSTIDELAYSRAEKKTAEMTRYDQAILEWDEQILAKRRQEKNRHDTAAAAEWSQYDENIRTIKDEAEQDYESRLSALENIRDAAISQAESIRTQKDQALAKQEQDLYDNLLEAWRESHGGDDPPDPWDEEAREHFQPYIEMIEEHEQLYIDNSDECNTAICSAKTAYAAASSNIRKPDEAARELWQIDLGQYQELHGRFKKNDPVYGRGAVAVSFGNLIAAYAKYNYDFHTGAAYPDYENEDPR